MRIHPVIPVVLATVTAAACGGSARAPVINQTAETPPGMITSGTSADVRLSADNRPVEQTIPVSPDTAWRNLTAVWRAFGFPVAQADPTRGMLRSDRFRARSQINRIPMREFMDCGYSAAGPRADLWDVYLEVTSAMRPAGPVATRLSSVIVGSARPRDGTGTSPVPCTSTGKLERLIADQVSGGT